MGETPADRIEILRQKLSSLRPNLISHLMNRDAAAGEILQRAEVPPACSPRITSTDDKVGDNPATERVGTKRFIGRRDPGPLSSLISSVLQPKPSDSDVEAVRQDERDRVLAELAQAEAERKKQAEVEKQKQLEKPALL